MLGYRCPGAEAVEHQAYVTGRTDQLRGGASIRNFHAIREASGSPAVSCGPNRVWAPPLITWYTTLDPARRFSNLAKNPDEVWLEVGKRKFKARPELVRGDEYEAAYGRVVRDSAQYAGYRKVTDRHIPIVRLKAS